MPGIDLAVDRCGEDDTRLFLQPHEGVAPDGRIRRAARASDRDQAPTRFEPGQRRGDMAQRRIFHGPVNMGDRRKGRIHQHHARTKRDGQPVVDCGGVMAGHGNAGEQELQQFGAGFGQLVEREARPRQQSMDGEQTGAGRRFEHMIARADRCRCGRDESKTRRGRELLQGLRCFRSARMRGHQRRDTFDQRQRACRRAANDRRAISAQEQDLGGLAGIIGTLPVPEPFSVAAAKGLGHRGAKRRAVDRAPSFERGLKAARGGQQGVGAASEAGRSAKWRGARRRVGQGMGHG